MQINAKTLMFPSFERIRSIGHAEQIIRAILEELNRAVEAVRQSGGGEPERGFFVKETLSRDGPVQYTYTAVKLVKRGPGVDGWSEYPTDVTLNSLAVSEDMQQNAISGVADRFIAWTRLEVDITDRKNWFLTEHHSVEGS